jgi:protein disulfide-isomerase A1
MSCSATPRNPQHPNWRDKFSARVEGKELKVKREDASGWDQLLKLNCCDTIVKDSKENKRYDFTAPSIVMFMPHDERFDRYTGDLDDFHALEKWVSSRRTPMVMELNEDTASKILDSGNADKMPILFLVNGKADHKEVMKKAAPTLRGRVLVCFSGAMSPVEKRLSEMVGIEDDQAVVVLIQVHDGQFGQPQKKIEKYRLDWDGKTLEARSVEKFVKSFEGNTLKPWLRSEPVPGPEDSHGPVQVLVGSTFEDGAVNTKDVDVLVNFYAPWCGHCRKFEPEYRALAKKLKHVKTLSIAKIDATRNEVPQVQVMAFPTVLLFPAGVDKISRKVSYHGHRTPADITKWLHQHCTHTFSETAPVDYTPPPTSSGLLDDEEEDL